MAYRKIELRSTDKQRFLGHDLRRISGYFPSPASFLRYRPGDGRNAFGGSRRFSSLIAISPETADCLLVKFGHKELTL